MKIRIIWIGIMLVFIGCFGCSEMNDLHDKYLQLGEAIYVGQVDSVKLFPGRNRVKITYRNHDPKVSKLMVYWDFRQGSASFDVSKDNLGKDVDEYIENLDEKNYTFELVTSNYSGEYTSIPLYISGPVYGSRYKASLTDRKIVSATYFSPSPNERMEISWASAIENMVGVEVLYRNASNKETVLKITSDDTDMMISDSKDNAMTYRTLYLPEKTCIDTFYTDYTSIDFATKIEYDKLNKLLFSRWNPDAIPYTALNDANWGKIENLWDGNLCDTDPGFMSLNPTNVSVNPWNITFDIGQLAIVGKMKLYPRLTSNQAYVQSHPKKITVWGSPTPDVTADFATWLYLGEYNSVRPSGNTTSAPNGASTPAVDLTYCRAGENFEATENTDVPVRYIRLVVVETWVTPNSTVGIMEIELFGIPEK